MSALNPAIPSTWTTAQLADVRAGLEARAAATRHLGERIRLERRIRAIEVVQQQRARGGSR